MAAGVRTRVGEHRLARPGDATGVVVELDVLREIAGVPRKLRRIGAFLWLEPPCETVPWCVPIPKGLDSIILQAFGFLL